MFGRSPPNILATSVVCFLLFLQFQWSPTQAKPYSKQEFLSTYTAGNLGGVREEDWPEFVNYKNGQNIERSKRSPTEVEDETLDSSVEKTLSVRARKRQGIETPIQPLNSDSPLDLPHFSTEEHVRSKVNQPDSESVGVTVEEEKKADDDISSTKDSKGGDNNVKPATGNESNELHQDENVSSSNENLNNNKQRGTENKENLAAQDKSDSSKVSLNTDSSTDNKNSKDTGESKADLSRSVDENAQVRTVQGTSQINKIGNIPNDKSGSKSTPLENDQSSSVATSTKTNQQEIQTTNTNNANKQQVDTDVSKPTAAKPETSGLVSSNQKPAAPTEQRPPANAQLSEESKPINTVPQIKNEPEEPVRDALGNSGSEIVTTHSPREPEPELDSYSERSAEAKPSNGPEVGHFQVDDKSADLEINANSAGVKVKAKPASLQVVSRPGSHAASGAQERSLFGHYHYPPYHVHHHWYPGLRRSYGHFHRRHFFNPYPPFPERRSFERFYDEAPFYRRRLHYWYPHRHRHHFPDSYLYERSQLEEPEEPLRYRRRRRHKRRFRHMNGPYRRQFYNNIPITNGMESTPMGVPPEEGTMPQLPIGPLQPFAQRQNIITPMPPPINVAGNPPPGLLGGMNAENFPMNEMSNFNGINQVNGAFNGMGNIGTTGFNSPEQIGAIEGLPVGMNGGLEGMQAAEQTPGITRELPNRKTLAEEPRKAFKKTAIVSGKKDNHTTTKEHSHDQNTALKNKHSEEGKKMQTTGSTKKAKINLKSWEKTLKRYHRLNKFTSKSREKHQFRRSTKSSSLDSETKNTEGKVLQKHRISHLHSQRAKDTKGKRKNEIIMHRPPIIYHPPPEIYHRPDIVVHRAPIMLHRPPIIYHQPPVVVHRPAIIYHQPPIVFHQPPPMVHQPILRSHDTWVTKPVVYHTASTVSHDKTYFGVPSHVYTGSYGEGCHGGHCSYRKGSVPHRNNSQATLHKIKTKRDSLSDYMAYFTSLWKANGMTKRNVHDDYDFITSRDGAKQKLIYTSVNSGGISKRDSATDYNRYIHSIWNHKVKREAGDLKNGTEKKKKKDVVVNRPPIIYHPPPEIYHRPDIVVHRPPLVIHRPPIIYHQPPVIVHRPAVVYHQPPIVFHQPPPAVSQPLLYSHDSFTVHPTFFATHHGSVVRDFGHYVGVPNVITNYGNPLFGRGPPIGKRSKIETPNSINETLSKSSNSTETTSKKATIRDNKKKEKNDTSEKAKKKNTVLVHRPPIIYHPPPEIYHRPVIVVHRPPIMIHRAPIYYHQPPVVVHRPAIVYHQPPLIFHQPPPMVHQPILRSHDTWISHHVVVPYSSSVMHHHTYVGVPDAFTVHHFAGGHSFYKSDILRHNDRDNEHASERNEITGKKTSTEKQKDLPKKHKITSHDKTKHTLNLKIKKAAAQKGGKKNAVIVRRPPVIYHPPPEIYHRPEIVVHRAPIVIHRAPIIYHQPPVIVHRPAIVYHQPALIFHQPPPIVHQPFYRSHDTYVHMPVARLYSSRINHVGHTYHIPHAYYHGHGGVIHHMAYDKSKVPQKQHIKDEKGETRTTVKKRKKSKTEKTSHHVERKHATLTKSKDKTETGTKLHKNHKIFYHKAKETTEKANKKNSVVIHRPPIIYHPPPEIYHRPDIVVHRAPIVLYRAPIVYHQPPVVVHRPAIVYHQPPIVFHQPPPMVHQPVLHSQDTWVTKPVAIPYASHVHHIATYRGVPHEEIFMHGIGTGAFGKSRVPVRGTRRNKIDSVGDERKNQTDNKETKEAKNLNESNYKGKNRTTRAAYSEKQGKDTIGAAERIIRALTDSLTDKRLEFMVKKNPIGVGARIQRSLQNIFPVYGDSLSLTALNPHNSNKIPGQSVGAVTRIQRSNGAFWSPVGAGASIRRAVAEPWNTLEGENPYEMNKRSSEESENPSTPDENADKNTNSTKKTILIIRRPPILYHPPSHMIHRPSIVVHRPDIIVHRHPIVFHRPPILVHRPPIIIHRQPVLIHRPPVIVHRPPLVFHRPPIIIHRRPYIIHHHPILFHRPPIIIHRGPQMIVHHSHLIHHYPMHMIHMHCPGCGFGKSTVARLQGKRTDQDGKKTSNSDRQHKDATVKDSQRKDSNLPKRSVADKKLKKSSREEDHNKKKKDGHKKKKDVVVNRPPIIYHPPPEVYHRPDIVVHRAPILIHRPPIVYHQPPVVVHRPAVVYHQPPIVFHQPAPAVNQPLLFSHDSFVVHPMAFASHMGSVVNDAGHYVGLPHGGVTNYPGSISHGPTGHIIPYLNPPNWSRRAQVSKPQDEKHTKINHGKNNKDRKRSSGTTDGTHTRSAGNSRKLVIQESKETKGERKNKVIVARPPLIYHPPPEIYDRPDIIVHRPDIVIHQPSVVYHQPSVVVHRAPVVYHQPPVVFHQPAPMVSQPVYHAHDTYMAHPVYHPQESHISHSATYVGAPHYYPGYNSYGWGLQGNIPTAHVQPTPQIPQYGYTTGPAHPGFSGYTPYSASLGNAFGRSKVENKKKDKFKDKETKLKNATKKSRTSRSVELSKCHLHHHHHHHHRHRHHGIHYRGRKRFYPLHPMASFAHPGHRKHVVIIHQPPLIYHPPPQVYTRPDILMRLPPLVYHRPAIMFQQPPTVVHHPQIVYHQPPVVFHNPPSIVHTPVIHTREMLSPHLQHVMIPTSSYMNSAGNFFEPGVSGTAYGKAHIERTDASKDSLKSEADMETKSKNKNEKSHEKRDVSNEPEKRTKDTKISKKQNVDLVVHQPPVMYHPPPDIIDKPAVVMHQPPIVVHRPPILIHRPPVVVHSPPVIIHRAPIVLHDTAPVYHVPHGNFFHPMRYAFGKSTVEGENQQRNKDKHSKEKHDEKTSQTKGAKHSNTEKAKRKNTVLVNRPAMIYHPPPEIYHRPNIIVHRPDIVIHRPSIVYHQPSVLIHKPPIIYRQAPVVFHQPPPMVHEPILHAHDSYLAYPVALPYTSHIHHAATYVGAPHFFDQPHFGGFGGYVGHAFGKSEVEETKKTHRSDEKESKNKKHTNTEVEKNPRSTRDVDSEKTTKENKKSTSTVSSKGHKKNKVIINRPPLIYHPPPEIYDRPDVIVHRPDIVIHRPSIVYHQSSVVVHRPPIVYQAPSVVFHQPPPLVNQPIMHAHETYVAHPVPVPYTSHIQHTSTYVGSPHHYPGGWHYGWSQPQPYGFTWSQHQPFGLAFGKSNVPAAKLRSSGNHKPANKHKVKRAEKDQAKENDKNISPKSEGTSKKKNQVLIQRPPLIYHPPPDVYHKPDIIVHRPDIVIHRPSVVYHQPSVVVHRPPVVYHQPPVVFHQPSPMVSQPVLHAHDTYVAHPYFTPYSSDVYHCGSYVGAPHCYNGGWGEHGYGFAHAFGKSKIQVAHKKQKHQKYKSKDIKGHRRTLEKEIKEAVDEIKLKKEAKKGIRAKKKNLVIMRRPPLVYHPPPEIYHKPDVILHRPDIVIHRPSVVFHQPSVVVHRPPVIYQQPPVIFHQPAPMVHQPILHSHDTYFAHPHFVPFASHLHHAGSYVGAPHFYPGGWGLGGHTDDFHHAFGKSKVEKSSKQHVKSDHENKDGNDNDGEKRSPPEATDSSEENKHKGKIKEATKGHKKNLVIMRRPPLIYHPPPEIYHKPDIILHRPDIVIHRPSVVFHQPSAVVHRPPVIYHQPPVVFHQPSPMVHQPIFHSHETYVAHPHFVPYLSHLTHAGSYVGAPHFFPGHWGPTHGFGHLAAHAFGKSKVEKAAKKVNTKAVTPRAKSEEAAHFKTKREAKHENLHRDLSGVNQKAKLKQQYRKATGEKAERKAVHLHPEKETKKGHHKAHRKNLVLIQRPALIYHPPPEIYDRPAIIVHRPDVVIHQPSVVYHQSSVVVHRPPIIYRPPPVVFHQPAPMVHQPMYTSHDIYHSHPHFVPYASHIKHTQTYVGAPHYYPGGWRYGYGFSEAPIPQHAGLNGWNAFNSPWYQPSLYRANYLTPTGVASPSGIRRRYQSAFAKSDVQKHDAKTEDLKDNHKKKDEGSQKSHHVQEKTGKRNRRSTESTKRRQGKGRKTDEEGKKNVVMIRRPPLVYHPPPEIYHKPDVIVHRPDVVIHQPSVVYHQPSVVVHRPPVIYNQPPVVFHQPAPMVNQPIFHAHENYMAHPYFVPYASQIHHTGTYVGAPEFFHEVRAFGKSDVSNNKSKSKKPHEKSEKKNKMVKIDKRKSAKAMVFHPQEEREEKPSRKNDIVVSRPPIIYHPPPEIYHRPDIVVHRAPIVLHRPPIIYHQPPVVVHRPAVVYHQPPIVFHQPPPTVHQPILHSHDSFVVRPAAKFFPQGSTLTHTMNYVGIPNHVIHGDELAFHHFHRSQIEHSGRDTSYKKPSTVQVAKSTISKIPTTNKENTQTTITDQTQKKTLRSIIRHHKLTKRQLIGSHSLFGSFSPINNIQDSEKSVEQNEKLSTIPGDTSIRENSIAKRQLIAPESIESVFPNFMRNSLPSVYNTLEMAALQNQALAASEDSPVSDKVDQVHLPGFTPTLPTLHGIGRSGIERYPFLLKHYLPGAPKDDSPDVRVHIETAKSSIPIKARGKRQIIPIFQQQEPPQVYPALYQSPSLENLEGAIREATPSSVYRLFSPYNAISHPGADPYHYLRIPSVSLHHPRVNINVQSARSTIPHIGHAIQKRSNNKKSKRQFLAVMPPLSSRLPVGLGGGIMPLPFSPYSALSRFPYPILPRLDYPQEPETEETAFSEALPVLHRPSSIPHTPYSGFSEDQDNDSPSFNPVASYLAALYNGYFGYPFYRPHKKPKVHVEVHASKSQIPKVTENRKYGHSRISKRQLYNFLPRSPVIANHYTLPAALNYGIQGFHQNSPHVSINVETAKRQGIPSLLKEKRSPVAKKLKQHEQRRTGDKRDQLLQNGENGQESFPYQENSNSVATQDNQFVISRESSQPQEEIATNNNEIAQPLVQQQLLQEAAGQQQEQQEAEQQQEEQQQRQLEQQEQQQTIVQQPEPFPNQLTMEPFQAQQLAFRAPLTPMQVPMQPPGQPAFNAPFVAPFMAPVQGVFPGVLPGVSGNHVAEQAIAQPGSDAGEGQPKHTSINVNVAAKSIVPKKTSKKNKKSHNPKFTASQQRNIPKKSAMEKGFEKRERISLLTRFPAMQVLPQTFKQDGVLMPAFNTLPVNHRIKGNGMLLEELQRQRKHQIPKTAKHNDRGSQTDKENSEQVKPKENANKRQFYGISQSMLTSQPYVLAPQPKNHLRPKVSVNVEVSKRKSAFPNGKFHLELKDVESGFNSNEMKPERRVSGIEQKIQMPNVDTPRVRQIPSKVQRHRVTVHGERATKKGVRQQVLKRGQNSDKKRQIYGFSELPNQGLMQPLSLGSQNEPLGYLPRALHSPRISINVEASKRSPDPSHDVQKRQLLGLQPDAKETLDQAQEPVPSGQPTYQSDDLVAEDAAQLPIQVQDQSRENEVSPMAIESNPTMTQQQQVQDLSPDSLEPQDALTDIFNKRPRVSVHVEASKRGKNERKLRSALNRKQRSVKEKTGGKRQFQQMEQGARDYGPYMQGQRPVMDTQQLVVEQQQQQISQPLDFISPVGQQQNVEQFQPVMFPVAQPGEAKARPKVSINVETAKSSISGHSDHSKEYGSEKKTKRQLFGTVPLLSSLGQTTAPGGSRKIINPRSSVPLLTGKPADKKDLRLRRRQLYNYLGGQQEQILPTKAIQDTTEFEQQQQEQQQDIPIQASQQDVPVTLQQASVLESSNQYQGQIEEPENTQTAPAIPTQPESSFNPLGTIHRPRVSINVQTAKSKVPSMMKAKIPKSENKGSSSQDHEKKKFKRQFDILGGGGEIERRRRPKFLTAPPLKKGRGENLFGLGTNVNKPVEVFANPIANLVAGRKRPKFGGIQIDSPTDVGALRLKGGANPLGGALASDVGAPPIIQDSAAAGIAPFVQEPAATGSNPFLPPSGIAGPQIDALEKGDTGTLPIAGPPLNRPAIIPLPALNQAFFQNLPLATATGPPTERPLLLSPRVLPLAPILPMAVPPPPPLAVPPEAVPQPLQTLDEAEPELQHDPQIGAVLPPVIPMPFPNIAAPPPLPKPETLIPESDDDKPSVHVNVETSRSHVPDTKHHSKHQATGRANRG